MISECFLSLCLCPPWTPGLWSVGQPVSWEAEPWGLPKSHNQSEKLVLPPMSVLCFVRDTAFIGGRAAFWLCKGQGLNPCCVNFCVTLKSYSTFSSLYFLTCKMEIYSLLFGQLRWIMCLAYNKQSINGSYNNNNNTYFYPSVLFYPESDW